MSFSYYDIGTYTSRDVDRDKILERFEASKLVCDTCGFMFITRFDLKKP